MATEAERRMLAWCILHCTTSCAIILIVIYHVYCICKAYYGPEKEKQKRHCILNILDIYVIVCFLMHSAYDAVTNIMFYAESVSLSDEWCLEYGYWRSVTYQLGKFSLYLMWITQIYVSYKESSYGYSLRFVIIPMYILDVIFIVLFVSFLNHHLYNAYSDGYTCTIEWNWATLFGTLAVFDAFLNISTLFLFVRPLIQILKAQKITPRRLSEDKSTHKFVRLIVKKIILVVVAIISSNLFLTFEFFGIPLVPIDDVVNTICILMMLSLHRNSYEKVCGNTETKLLECTVYRSSDTPKIQKIGIHSVSHCIGSSSLIDPFKPLLSRNDGGLLRMKTRYNLYMLSSCFDSHLSSVAEYGYRCVLCESCCIRRCKAGANHSNR